MSQEAPRTGTKVDASGAYIPVAGTAPVTAAVLQPTAVGTAPIPANVVPAVRTTAVPASAATAAYAPNNAAVIAAKEIGAGRMPPNAAIQGVLDTARQTIESEKLANPTLAQGQTAQKLQNVIAATQMHLAEKNADEKYQRFVQDSATAASSTRPLAEQAVRAAEGPARETGQQMPPIGRLVRTLASSGEFRNTLISGWNWLQQLFAGAINAPSTARTGMLKSAVQGQPPNEAVAREQDALWLNFAQFVRVLGSNPDYQLAIEGLFSFIDEMTQIMPDSVSSSNVDQARLQARRVFNDARAIIEELAGGYSMESIITDARSIRGTVQSDQRINVLLFEARQFLESMLRQPALLDNPAEVARGRSLIQTATSVTREYRDSIFVREFFRNVSALLNAIRTDPSNKRLAEAFKEFAGTIVTTNTQTGQRELNTQGLAELRQLLVPLVMEQLRSVPISTIDGSTETYDFRFDGIILAAHDIAPDRVRVKYDNDLEFDFRSLSLAETRRSDLTIYFEGMRTVLNNVHFWYRRKSFPKISDEGIANISLEGEGMDLKFRVRVAPSMPYFHVSRVDCDIDRMKIRIIEAKHSALDKIVTSVFSGTIRKRVELAIEERLAVILQRVEETMNRLAQQAGRAVQSGSSQVPSIADKLVQAVKPSSSSTAQPGAGKFFTTGSSS